MTDIQNYELDIDLKQNLLITVACKQLDNLNLVFNIWNDGQVANLSDYTCRLKALKSDQVPLIQDIDIIVSNNVVKIKCNQQLTTTQGIVKAELQFIDKTTKEKKTSFNIEIDVIKSTLEVNRSISKATYDLLQELEYNLDKVEDLEFNFNQADKLNKEIKNTTTPNANNVNNTLVKNIDTANTKKNELDGSINNANKAKQILDSGNSQAITNKKDLDESNVQASKNLDALNALGNATDLAKDVEIVKKQVLENTYTKIETDSTLTKLESCKDSFVHNMQIKGRTLQNLVVKGNIVKEVKVSYETLAKYDYTYSLKQNTKYTVVFNSSKTTSKQVVINLNSGIAGAEIFTNSVTVGLNKITLDTGNYTELKSLWVYFKKDAGATESDFFNISDVMLLEGEPKEIPSYFEGIKSVGEAEGNKISILTKGKNLFNIDEAQLKSTTTIEKNYSSFVLNGTGTWAGTQQKIKLKPKTTYTISGLIKRIKGGTNCYVQIRDKVKNTDYNRNYFSTFTTPSDISDDVWLYFVINSDKPEDSSVEFSSVQLEEGSTATNYEPYKEDKTEILTTEPLRGLPNGVADIADYDRNECTRNVAKTVFTGSNNEKWILRTDKELPNTVLLRLEAFTPEQKTEIGTVISDRFHNKIVFEAIANNDVEATYLSFGGNLHVRISKSKLSTPDVAGFKKWLQANPVTVYYQLAEPVIEKLSIKDTLQAFENGYIQLDNAITPYAQLEYSTNIMSIVSRVVENQDKLIDRLAVLESTILTLVSNNIVNK